MKPVPRVAVAVAAIMRQTKTADEATDSVIAFHAGVHFALHHPEIAREHAERLDRWLGEMHGWPTERVEQRMQAVADIFTELVGN